MTHDLRDNETRTIPKGAIVVFSSGEYSSYGVWTIAIATRDIDIPLMANDYPWPISALTNELLKTGALREVDYYEWHSSADYAEFHRGELSE